MKATVTGTDRRYPTRRLEEQSESHEYRARFLEALATLVGCQESFGGELPDGRRPDVMRIDSAHNVLFLGEAKHSESPGNVATRARLQKYLLWLSTHVLRREGVGIFAVCFGREEDAKYWSETISLLESEVGMEPDSRGAERFQPGLILVWSVFLPQKSVCFNRLHLQCASELKDGLGSALCPK